VIEIQRCATSDSPAGDGVERWCRIDDTREYRYELGRRLPAAQADRGRTVLFVMLNPSTADGFIDDATIRRCVGFARRLDHGTILVGNLFACRATDPRALRHAVDPVGPLNTEHVENMARRSQLIIAAWGNAFASHKTAGAQVQMVHDVARRARLRLHCLGVTGQGHPRHPLYLPASAPLLTWPEHGGFYDVEEGK
jgi:hypothetical protein